MLNFRQIDKVFFLAGGWEHIVRDAEWLKIIGIKHVLDMQFTPPKTDYLSQIATISGALSAYNISYEAIPMWDGENSNLEDILNESFETISEWRTHIRDKILIKCGAGVSRSVSVLINYYCLVNDWSYLEAKDFIARKDNQYVIPISIDVSLANYLKGKFPDYDY